MPGRIYNGAGFGDDAAYRDIYSFDRAIKRPEAPVPTEDWGTVLRYGEEWGPQLVKENKRARALSFLRGYGMEDVTIEPDVAVSELSVKYRPLRPYDPKSWITAYDLIEKPYDLGWTLRRTYNLALGPESDDVRQNVALTAGRLVLTSLGKFLYLQEKGLAGTDDHYRWDSLLQDPVKVALYKQRKGGGWLEEQVMKYHHNHHLETPKTYRARVHGRRTTEPAFASTDYRTAVITLEKIENKKIADLTPKMAVAGLRDFLKRYRMIRSDA